MRGGSSAWIYFGNREWCIGKGKFRGDWTENGTSICKIDHKHKLIWHDGTETKVEYLSRGRIQRMDDGVVGELQPHGKLSWNNGDVWMSSSPEFWQV